MKKKTLLLFISFIVCILGSIALYFVDRFNESWWYLGGAILLFILALVCLIIMRKVVKNTKASLEEYTTKDKIKQKVEHPESIFDFVLRDSYYGTLIEFLNPLFIEDCQIYESEEGFGVEVKVKKNEESVILDINETNVIINDKILDYGNFEAVEALYEEIKKSL